MKREDLVDFTDEQKDLVMSLYGKAISKREEQIENLRQNKKDLETKITSYETQINELNKTIETNTESLKNLQDLTNENNDLKAEIQLGGSNVKKEFSKFVRNEVMNQVNDENDFASVLENYKKENPQYFGETVIKKVQSSPNLNNGVGQATTTNDIMNDILRSSRNNN